MAQAPQASASPAEDSKASATSVFGSALAESLTVINGQLSNLSRAEQRNLLSSFDKGNAESWQRRKRTHERLLRTLEAGGKEGGGGGANKTDEYDAALSPELRSRLFAQV